MSFGTPHLRIGRQCGADVLTTSTSWETLSTVKATFSHALWYLRVAVICSLRLAEAGEVTVTRC